MVLHKRLCLIPKGCEGSIPSLDVNNISEERFQKLHTKFQKPIIGAIT